MPSSTTLRPRPPWFPESRPPNSWTDFGKQGSVANQTNATAQIDEADSEDLQITTVADLDTEDREDESTDDDPEEDERRVIQVPK